MWTLVGELAGTTLLWERCSYFPLYSNALLLVEEVFSFDWFCDFVSYNENDFGIMVEVYSQAYSRKGCTPV